MDHEFTHQLYGQFARIGKAVSNGHRIVLLHYLSQGERSVEVLSRLSGLSIANTSQHLQQLRHAGLVSARKAGQHVFYRLSDNQGVLRLLNLVQTLATRQLAEVSQLIASHLDNGIELVAVEELRNRATRQQLTVVDVRPEEEFAAGHIAGALNMPMEQLATGSALLDKDQEIVTYCRGPFSALSHEAAHWLHKQGFKARRLAVGFPEWRLAGLEVESSRPEPVAA